jgi:hypothetical protein
MTADTISFAADVGTSPPLDETLAVAAEQSRSTAGQQEDKFSMKWGSSPGLFEDIDEAQVCPVEIDATNKHGETVFRDHADSVANETAGRTLPGGDVIVQILERGLTKHSNEVGIAPGPHPESSVSSVHGEGGSGPLSNGVGQDRTFVDQTENTVVLVPIDPADTPHPDPTQLVKPTDRDCPAPSEIGTIGENMNIEKLKVVEEQTMAGVAELEEQYPAEECHKTESTAEKYNGEPAVQRMGRSSRKRLRGVRKIFDQGRKKLKSVPKSASSQEGKMEAISRQQARAREGPRWSKVRKIFSKKASERVSL